MLPQLSVSSQPAAFNNAKLVDQPYRPVQTAQPEGDIKSKFAQLWQDNATLWEQLAEEKRSREPHTQTTSGKDSQICTPKKDQMGEHTFVFS